MKCSSCEAMAARAEEVAMRNEELQRLLTKTGKENVGLRSTLAQMYREDVPRPDVEFVVGRWRGLTGRSQGRPVGPKQEELVARALKARWCGRERALKAIRGYARFPYVVKGVMGRSAAPSHPDNASGERFDELSMVLRDDETIEKGCRYADRADREDGLSTDTPPWVCDFLDSWPVFDELGPRPSIKAWVARCPVCGEPDFLRVVWTDQGAGRFEALCAKGCDPVEVARRCEGLRDGVAQGRLAA